MTRTRQQALRRRTTQEDDAPPFDQVEARAEARAEGPAAEAVRGDQARLGVPLRRAAGSHSIDDPGRRTFILHFRRTQ